MLHHRWTVGCQHATMWPYPRDAIYFGMLAMLASLCWFAVFIIEAYAIWFVVFANENTVRDKYGVLGECNLGKESRTQHAQSSTVRSAHSHCWRWCPGPVAECKMCYDYRAQAAETCRSRAQNATCWDAAKLGYCSFTDTLLNKFNINSTQVRLLSGVSNTGRLPEAIPPHMRSKTAML